MLHFHIITLFPESIEPYFHSSMLGRALREKKVTTSFYNPRNYTADKHKRVDRRPYGGGPGMVLEPESVLKAASVAIGRKRDVEVLFFSPSGEAFDMAQARQFSKRRHIVMICGHYEGVDARVPEILGARHISIGPFTLTGGELPAAVVADATTRLVPGVLGNEQSLEDERIASPDVYTRPETLKWKGKEYTVPEVLRSGHHEEIEKWRAGKRNYK